MLKLHRLLVSALALAFASAQLVAVDCRTDFADLKTKVRRAKAIECAKSEYAKEKEKADGDYRWALDAAHAVYQTVRESEANLKEGRSVYEVTLRDALAAHERSLERARQKRDETIRLNTKHGVFAYGAGMIAAFPSKRITEARLDADGVVQPVAYAQEAVRPVLAASYFPRDLTWGLGNRRWGLGPTVFYEASDASQNLGLGLMLGVTRSGDREGPVSFGLDVAYHLDNKVKELRRDFVPGRQAPLDAEGNTLQPIYVETAGHSFAVVITVSFWDSPGS